MKIRLAALGVLFVFLVGLPALAADEAGRRLQTILHMLDYVAVDYPGVVENGQVKDDSEYQEQIEFSTQVEAMVNALPAIEGQERFGIQARELLKLITDKRPGSEVAAVAQSLRQSMIQTYAVATAPKSAPDVKAAAMLFAENCAGCHGEKGMGDGVQASALDPRPSNFHDRARQEQLSVFGLYSTISLGVSGTAMPAFNQISERERWGLAFFVSSLSATEAELSRGAAVLKQGDGKDLFTSLSQVTTVTVMEAEKRHGADGRSALAYLRTHPDALAANADAASLLAFSARTLDESLAAYQTGDLSKAQQLAVTAYLEGFELVEAQLDAADKDLRGRIEYEMMQFRGMLKAGTSSDRLNNQLNLVHSLLDQAKRRLESNVGSSATNFVSSLVILLREGLEAILIVAGIAAFLNKTQRRDGLRYVHAGWIIALLLGIGTWFAASRFVTITGANREVTEGVTALISAAVLLYVGYWLHDKSHALAWRQYLESKMKNVLSRGALWLLALLSFFAVYREVFETVLFYQALWAQAGPAGHSSVLMGFVIAAAALVIIAWLVARFSVRLPLRLFFGVSSALIAIMAVIFAGKGIAALQEAGTLSVNLVNFPAIPMLGIYPHLESLLLQALVVCVIIAVYAYSNHSARRRAES